jgi:beta-1,4-mannosyltransferase
LLICHSRDAARRVAEQHQPRGRMVVMPHGNYAGVYPPARSRDDVLHELGLRSDRPTVCAIGHLRRYKGLDVAIQGIAQLAGKVQLIVVGKPHRSLSSNYLAELRNEIDGLDGGVMVSREVSEQEYADVVGASEAVLLSYKRVTTSGAMLSALTLGRGVVAPHLPYFAEMLEPETEAGALFAPGHSGGLANAVERYLQIPAERRAAAARRLAERYTWERCITSVGTVFEAWVREKKERIRARGIHLIHLLNILVGFDVAGLGFGTVDGIHLLAEALRDGAD